MSRYNLLFKKILFTIVLSELVMINREKLTAANCHKEMHVLARSNRYSNRLSKMNIC